MNALAQKMACGCDVPDLRGPLGLVDPDDDVLLLVRSDGSLVSGYPHQSGILARRVCEAKTLGDLFPAHVATLLLDRVHVAERDGTAATIAVTLDDGVTDVVDPVRVRVAPDTDGTRLFLQRPPPDPRLKLFADTRDESSFWALFEAAPIPLAISVDDTHPKGLLGTTRFNRRFTEMFGYTQTDVPTVQHWWPLAYPDPVYRVQIRDEWFRRVRASMEANTATPPLAAVVTCKDGSKREIEFGDAAIGEMHLSSFIDFTDQKAAERELEARVAELKEALAHVRALQGLLPLCSWCRKLKDDTGTWRLVEEFLAENTDARITHGICPTCREKHFWRPSP